VFSVLEKPAFLILLILLLVVGMIVAIVIVASRSRSRSSVVVASQPGSVPPGWYPQAGGGQAYWNGAAWTGDVQPPTGSTASA
jgi:hypothetical protein